MGHQTAVQHARTIGLTADCRCLADLANPTLSVRCGAGAVNVVATFVSILSGEPAARQLMMTPPCRVLAVVHFAPLPPTRAGARSVQQRDRDWTAHPVHRACSV
jgi:hypothetical protein